MESYSGHGLLFFIVIIIIIILIMEIVNYCTVSKLKSEYGAYLQGESVGLPYRGYRYNGYYYGHGHRRSHRSSSRHGSSRRRCPRD